jgi:Eukaryotic protein of unknown function (DUF866)
MLRAGAASRYGSGYGSNEMMRLRLRLCNTDFKHILKVLGYKEDEEEEGEGRETGTVFTDVDLTELEWADYDEKSNQSTVISGTKHQHFNANKIRFLTQKFLTKRWYYFTAANKCWKHKLIF